MLPSTCRGLLIYTFTHMHTHLMGGSCSPVPLNVTLPYLASTLSMHDILIGYRVTWCVCVSLGVCVTMLHNAAAGLNTPGSQNYDCMCQSQYLWKPKTLEPVHPSPLPSTCSFFLSPCGCLGYKPAPKPSGMTGSVCVDT